MGAIAVLGSMSGCSTMHFFYQAGLGQLELVNKARPIPEVLKDERVPLRTRKLLGEVTEIKKFGEAHGLKATPNYREYVALDRQAAVWVLSASDALAFKAKEWRFPIVGSFPYLGWFNQTDAINYAKSVKTDGLDVDVRGAGAYSTLGWFRDAVLSTMIPLGDQALGALVNVVLHESVHATLYIKNQSYFNESLANFVANQMTAVYLRERLGAQAPELIAFKKGEAESERRVLKFHETYLKLDALYRTPAAQKSDEQKREEKMQILAAFKTDLGIKREINNATLIQFRTYNVGMKGFEALYSKCAQDWKCFFASLSKLRSEDFGRDQSEDFERLLLGL